MENPNDAYAALSQNLIGRSKLSQVCCKLIGWYGIVIKSKLWTSTCPVDQSEPQCENLVDMDWKSLFIFANANIKSLKESISDNNHTCARERYLNLDLFL